MKSCLCCTHVAKLTTAVATETSSSKTCLLFRMPIQTCEAQEKVIHCADLSDQQKGQMLSQIITFPDRALPLFEVPEYLLAHTFVSAPTGPTSRYSHSSVLAVVLMHIPPPRSCYSQSCGEALLSKLPERSLACLERDTFFARHTNSFVCGFRLW